MVSYFLVALLRLSFRSLWLWLAQLKSEAFENGEASLDVGCHKWEDPDFKHVRIYGHWKKNVSLVWSLFSIHVGWNGIWQGIQLRKHNQKMHVMMRSDYVLTV